MVLLNKDAIGKNTPQYISTHTDNDQFRMTDSVIADLVLDTKHMRRMPFAYYRDPVLAYLCQPQMLLECRTTVFDEEDMVWDVNLRFATLTDLGRKLVRVNHEMRDVVYRGVLQTPWNYHVDVMKDLMLNHFARWLGTDSKQMLVHEYKYQEGAPSEDVQPSAFTFTGRDVSAPTADDPGHSVLRIRCFENDDFGVAVVESSYDFEYRCPCGVIAKYMSDQMFTERTNARLAGRVFANHLAIETRRLQSKFRIFAAKLVKARAFDV